MKLHMSIALLALITLFSIAPTASADGDEIRIAILSGEGERSPSPELAALVEAMLSEEPEITLVERKKLRAILQEQELTASALADTRMAIKIGALAGASHLLSLETEAQNMVLRLVEVASGRVCTEAAMPIRSNEFLTAAAVREAVLADLRDQSPIADRLLVGVAAFVNQSATDRSDYLNEELQKAVRERLHNEPWATALERQYPTGLLHEADLARLGLAANGHEQLPPADLTVMGVLRDDDAPFAGEESWPIQLELIVRLRSKAFTESLNFRSNDVSPAVDQIVEFINQTRTSDAPQASQAEEKVIWRRHALYLMPRSYYAVGRTPWECHSARERLDTREAIRAWENLLLLDPEAKEARLDLGVSLISLYGRGAWNERENPDSFAQRQMLRGTQLIEAVHRAEPNEHNAVSYIMALQTGIGYSDSGIISYNPERTLEMCKYVLANAGSFSDWQIKLASDHADRLSDDLLFLSAKKVIRNADSDPVAVARILSPLVIGYPNLWEKRLAFASQHVDHENPVVRFYSECIMAEALSREKKDPAALEHYDRAIALMETVNDILKKHTRHYGFAYPIDGIFWARMGTCRMLNMPEEEKKTMRAGVRHYMEVDRWNFEIAESFYRCIAEAFEDGDAKQGIDVCNYYLDQHERRKGMYSDYHYPDVFARKVQFQAHLSNEELPDFSLMTLLPGTQATALRGPSMVAAHGKIWMVWQPWQSGGPALVFDPAVGSAVRLKMDGAKADFRAVAAVGDRVYFGGRSGLYELDAEGKVTRVFRKKQYALPADHIVSLCTDGRTLYMTFREYDRFGVASFDPEKGIVTVLAPTSRTAKLSEEPVWDAYRVWWDGTTRRLYVNDFYVSANLRLSNAWRQTSEGWKRASPGKPLPRFMLTRHGETLQGLVENDRLTLEFLDGGDKLVCTIPLPELAGEPDWDARRIWVPGFMGLHEVDRQTGQLTWLAYKQGASALSVLKHEDKLYIATTEGLYRRDVDE